MDHLTDKKARPCLNTGARYFGPSRESIIIHGEEGEKKPARRVPAAWGKVPVDLAQYSRLVETIPPAHTRPRTFRASQRARSREILLGAYFAQRERKGAALSETSSVA